MKRWARDREAGTESIHKMQRYLVQRYDEGGMNTAKPQEVSAESEIEAAEIATGVKLRPFGRLSEMRVCVHRLGNFRQVSPTPFYAA